MSLGIRSFANTYSLKESGYCYKIPQNIIWLILIILNDFSTVEKYSSEHGYLSPASGPGAPGQFTKRPGILAFYEICDVTNKWYLRVVRDHESKEMFPNSDSLKYFTQNLNIFAKLLKNIKKFLTRLVP